MMRTTGASGGIGAIWELIAIQWSRWCARPAAVAGSARQAAIAITQARFNIERPYHSGGCVTRLRARISYALLNSRLLPWNWHWVARWAKETRQGEDAVTEILLTAEQIQALPELLCGLPTVARMRLSMEANRCVALSGCRGGPRVIVTRNGTVSREEEAE